MFKLRTFVFVVCLAALPGFAVQWRSGPATPPRELTAAERDGQLQLLRPDEGTRHAIVHVAASPTPVERQALATAGIELLDALGDGAYFARISPRDESVRAPAALVDVQPIHPEHKLHRDLARGMVHPWMRIERPKEMKEDLGPADEGPTVVALYVLFHRGIDVDVDARRTLARHGGKVVSWMRSIDGVVAHLPVDNVAALAAEDGVRYVEPPLPPLKGLNDSNRVLVEADALQQAPYDLDGSGVTVLVYDAGSMFAHGDFDGRLTVGVSDTSGISDHATHVGGTIGGDGAGSSGQFRGMAPAVDLISYGFEQEGGLSQGFLYTDPGDIEADYGEAIATYGADLSNNSIGTNTASNGYPCEWEGDYGATGALIDAIVGGSLGEPFRIVWANGNERSGGRCGSTYLTTAPPACAKNHITVGALNSNDDSVTGFTSWGPTDDGRIKPDISGPGCEVGSDGGVTSSNSSGGYNVKCGTSMASPTVAGIAALMLEQFRLSFPGEPDPRNATLKAILANTAVDIEEVGPDYKSGYGSVRGTAAIDLIADGRFVEAEVAQGETRSFIVIVDPADTELRVTLAWDDPPATPNVDPVLVNDLDLQVIGSGGSVHWPWTLDPANPSLPAVRTTRDDRNNIEQVTIDAPAPGAYRIDVSGFDVADGPTQSFSIAASPSLINCSSIGLLAASASRISCGGAIDFSVIDCDLNSDDLIVENVGITVSSDSEPAGEALTLVESAPESAAFEGTLPIATSDAAGTLLIAEGDTIVATYIDADDGEGGQNLPRTREIAVDCTAPQILTVAVADVQPRSASVAVDLDEAARVTVHHGTSCGVADGSSQGSGLSLSHSVDVRGLTDDTSYFVWVDAVDEAGNPASDDNGGACYGFTTPEVPDFFTESFTSGLDLEGSTATFTPDGTVEAYTLCVEPASAFLTDPTGGVDLELADDQPTTVTLADGKSVLLYGAPHSEIHVGPNGYVTFTTGDSTYNESISQHFSLPRVAALFDDLNPSSSGSVSWLQLDDRVAFTWQDVPEYSTTNTNSFQIELFFDGTIRITWLDIDVSDAIVGISAGNGQDPDFLPSDLSGYGACGPRPPVAQAAAYVTPVNTPLALVLSGSDDGEPAPSQLSYRIESLPLYGTLVDAGTGLTVVSIPHTLAGGANAVSYVPASDFQGEDLFGFTLSDGGAAPAGGRSNTASVAVTVGVAAPQVSFLEDDLTPNWSMTGDWDFGQPAGAGSNGGDPASGFTGLNVLGYNLAGDYDNQMPAETVTSDAIDLSGVVQSSIGFQRWLGVESSTYDQASFEISTDGSNWTPIWQHAGASFNDGAWVPQSFDISALADNQPSVYLRWVMGTTDGSVTYPGWNLDDIVISGVPLTITDCDPGDPDVSRAPGEVLAVRLEALPIGTRILWHDQGPLAGVGTHYEVLSGSMAAGLAAGSCLVSDSAVGHDDLRPDPLPGEGQWYLLRAWNGCGGSSFGSAGRDAALPDGDTDGETDLCQ